MKQIPVVIFAYQRPQRTRELLQILLKNHIAKIYLFSDGPKSINNQSLVDQVRQVVDSVIISSPKATIIKHYSAVNLGLKQSIVSGLNLVFKHESAAIILEDDCLPSPDFFPFMFEMLARYQSDYSVMSVTGSGIAGDSKLSYDFSRYEQCWGWATWQRAWRLYDPNLTGVDAISWPNIFARWYWRTMLFLVKMGQVNSWAFIWSYTHFKHQALAIIPSVNLITNVGFDHVATNTLIKSKLSNLEAGRLHYPLVHPQTVIENLSLTDRLEKKYYRNIIAILGLLRQYFYWVIKI